MPSVNLARERSLYKAFTDHAVQARQTDLARIQEQLSSGRRINRASDDASAFGQARRLDVLSGRQEQYRRSIDASRNWTDHTQQALDQMTELLTQASEQSVRYANGAFSGGERETAARSLEGLRESLVDQFNARINGEYLFAGARSTAKPFELADDGTVAYQGDAGSRERHIGRDERLSINIDGEALMDTGQDFSVIDGLNDMIAALRDGDPDTIKTALGRLNTARDHVVDMGAEAGTIANRLRLADDRLAEANIQVEARRSQLEDADYAEVITDFERAQTGLQAAVRVAASVLQTSILDYLR